VTTCVYFVVMLSSYYIMAMRPLSASFRLPQRYEISTGM